MATWTLNPAHLETVVGSPKGEQTKIVKNTFSSDTDIKGISLVSLDSYTRVGKSVIRELQSKTPELKFFSTKQIGVGLFYTEGEVVDKRLSSMGLDAIRQDAFFADFEGAQYTSQKWDDDISAWYDDRVTDYEYDDHHNQVHSISKKRDSGSGTLVNERRCYNYFSVNLLPVVEINQESSQCLFSNLVTDALTLNCPSLFDQTGLSIRIIDMIGREVIHAPFQSGASIPMEGVTPGLYFFQVLQ